MNIEENNIIQCFDEKLDLLNKIHNATLEVDINKIEEKDKEIERLKNACTEWLNKYDESENEKQTLEEEIERLKELCNKYEEEHKTTFEEWKKTINIINELEKWCLSWKENDKYCYLASNDKDKCRYDIWEEVLDKLQELKGSDK